MTHRTVRPAARHFGALLLAVAVGLVALHGPTPSSAIFTSSSQAGGQVAAAADWTPPTVRLTSPGAWVKEVVTVEVAATDSEGPVDRVVLERRATGTDAWVTVCTDTAAPFSCAWDTRGLADGEYALRARATDRAGLDATSTVARTLVANQLTTRLTTPVAGSGLRGNVTLTATVAAAGSLAHTVRLQHAAADGSSWTTICADLRSPYTCAWDTTAVVSGPRDLRAVVVDSDGRTVATSPAVRVTVDHVAPSIVLADPGTPLTGSRTFSTTPVDAHSGVRSVVVQAAATGTSLWRDLCTVNASPWNCQVATGTLTDGTYSFRAVATDVAGNTSTSALVTNRLVENTAPAVTVTAPITLAGTVEIGANASSAAGVTSVKWQHQRAGTTTWVDLCTDTSAPYACTWNTMPLTNGTYALRAVMVDGLGRTTTSVVANRAVDNRPFTAVDVQTVNGARSTSGRADNGDDVTYTFSHQIDPATVLAGWNGSSRTVMVQMNDSGSTIFSGSDEDTLRVVTTGGAPVNLGVVNLMGDYVLNSRTAEFEATMTASTVTAPDGTTHSVVTVRLGALQFWSLTALRVANHADPATMVWTPSHLVTDVYGRTCSPTPVTETGPLDREF